MSEKPKQKRSTVYVVRQGKAPKEGAYLRLDGEWGDRAGAATWHLPHAAAEYAGRYAKSFAFTHEHRIVPIAMRRVRLRRILVPLVEVVHVDAEDGVNEYGVQINSVLMMTPRADKAWCEKWAKALRALFGPRSVPVLE